jgi:hypothetical protein
MERNRIDLSKLERDDLRDLLSMARDEWVKYTNCKGEVEWCKKRIEEKEKDIESNQLMKKDDIERKLPRITKQIIKQLNY